MAKMLVTNGGIAAIRNAQATGTNKVTVTSVKIGSGKWTPTKTATALKTVIKTYTAIAGGAVGDNVIHVEAMDTSADAFTAYEVGIFLSDGTLLAVASDTTAILTKAASAQAMLAIDIVIADAGDVEFVFPSAEFSVPPATTEIQGVVELATNAEALAGTDAVRAVTPKALKAVADTKANVNHASGATTCGVGTGSNYGHLKLSDSINSASTTTGGIAATPKAVRDAKTAAIAAAEQADTAKVAKAGDTVTGAIHSTAGKTVVNGGSTEQFGGEMANSDKWRIAAGGTASDAGFVAIDTADNGNEQILVRQYSGGTFGTLVRQAALLDGSGKTSFPVAVTCPSFIGALTGNASSATKLQTARSLQVKDADQTNAGAAVNFDGSGNAVLKLPATIKAALTGNASTATKLQTARQINGTNFDGSGAIVTAKWGTARNIQVQDADGTNTGAAVAVDGSANSVLKLPATIKASLAGNASTATRLATARSITVKDNSQTNAGPAQNFDGSGNITLRLPATIKGSLDGNAATATLATKAQKDANGSQIDTTYLKRAGGTVTGTLILSRTTDLSGTANNKPALIIGGTDAQAHIEIDNNEIQAKANGTSVGGLYLQPDGGVCNVNGKRVVRGTGGGNTRHVYVDGDGNIVASNADVGGTAQGVYLKDGAITKMSGTVGATNTPAFLSGGVVKACTPYSKAALYTADPLVWSPKSGDLTKGEHSITGCTIGRPVFILHSVYSGKHEGAMLGIRVTDGALSGKSPDSGDYYQIKVSQIVEL